MLKLPPPSPSSHYEHKSQSEISLHDLPLNITSSIKLLSDIIAFSKFFLKKPTLPKNLPAPEAADTLISEILSLDIKRETPKDKRYMLSASYVAMAKADLFPNAALTQKDKEALLKFGFLTPLKQGEHIAFYLKVEKIFQYIDQFVNIKYQEKIKQVIDRACALVMMGFASYNLLISRRTFDKSQSSIATPYDPQNIIATEKGNIIKHIGEISTLKSSTTHSGDIARYQTEIGADIDQILSIFEGIELELIKTELKHTNQLVKKLVPALLKTKSSMIDLEPEIRNTEIMTMVRATKSHEQLLKEIDELETKHAYILAKVISQKEALETRTIEAEKQFQDLNSQYENELNKMKSLQLQLELKNQQLQDSLNEANAKTKKYREEIINKKNSIPWRHYAFAFIGFAIGAALCSSGIGLLPGAYILGVSTLVLSSLIMASTLGYAIYNLHQHYKDDNHTPPPSPVLAKRITTNLTQTIPLPPPHELKSNSVTQSIAHTTLSTKPLFSPTSQTAKDNEHDKEKKNTFTPTSQ